MHFMENVNKQQQNLISLCDPGYGSEEINSSLVHLQSTKYQLKCFCIPSLIGFDPLGHRLFRVNQLTLEVCYYLLIFTDVSD